MISITSKSPYALRALTELARTGADKPVPIGELARRRDIPVQFLEQLFAVLRRAGLARLALDHVGDRGLREDLAGGLGGVGEDALGVRADRAVEQLDHLEHGDLRGAARERVAALDPALGA